VSDKPRPLYVPDLSRPAGADVDAHGEVVCVVCGKHVSVMEADIVGKGYRCATCSAVATPEDNADASLSPAEQAMVPDPPKPRRLVAVGIALIALAVVMWITKFDVPLPSRARSLFMYVVVGAIGCIAIALSHPKKWS
jgi:hypothetical protein